MNCPGCGAENADNAEYCNLCFYRFAPQASAPPVAPAGAGGPVGAGASPEYPEQAAVPPFRPDAATPFTSAPAYDAPPPPSQWDTSGYPAQAYGAPPPPMPGVGPGGFQHPPSEWGSQPYDPGSYGLPPPPPTAVARKAGLQNSSVGKVLIVAIIVLFFFALGWFATDWYLTKREVSYVSAQSDISFRHPARWKKVSSSEVGSLAGILGTGNLFELMLTDANNDNWKFETLLGSVPATPQSWEDTKVNIDNRFGSGSSLTSPVGNMSVSGATLKDTTIAGGDAKDVTFKISSGGIEAEFRVMYIFHGARVYVLVFMTRSGASGAQGQVQKVIDSVEFKK